MLDKSGSMYGDRWRDLVNAVRQFLTAITADLALQAKSRVTIITYNSSATLTFNQLLPEISIMN